MSGSEQHWVALAKANEVRTLRAEMRREVQALGSMASSLVRLADSLELSDPEAPGYAPWLYSLRTLPYLKWGNRVGVQRAHAILGAAMVGPDRRLGDLTKRERQSLDRAMREAADRGTPERRNANETWVRRVLEEVR